MATLDWQKKAAIARQIQVDQWAEWVATARKPKDIVLKEVEGRLAKRLGLPFIPKDGMLSLGWIVKQLQGAIHGQGFDRAEPMAQVVGRLSAWDNHGNRRIGGISNLVFQLMCHREMLMKHGHNEYSYQAKGDETKLFDNGWNVLDEEVLAWAMLQSPFGEVDKPGDEFISLFDSTGDRLHNASGPIVTTSRGRIIYALNGVMMEPDEWKLRGNARQILAVQNVEVRRVLIEDMGTEEFLKGAGMVPIHKDETGKLYRVEGTDTGRSVTHLCWVHVECPSTGREYMLAVPPRTRTAREGVAWTFRKLPEEYSPQQET